MDISGLVEEIFFCFLLFFMQFFCSKEVLNCSLVFFLVLLGFLGAWQLLDEKDVDNFDKFILDELVVDEIEDLM